jgi:hypothetical protein
MINALAVVAHHDDAQIWMGGTICHTRHLKNDPWKWKIVALCLSGKQNTDWERYLSCYTDFGLRCDVETIQFHHRIKGQSDTEKEKTRTMMIEDLAASCKGEKFDYIFTHSNSPNGEYKASTNGIHEDHKGVREIVVKFMKEIDPDFSKKLAYFSYRDIDYADGSCSVVADWERAKYYFVLDYEAQIVKNNMCSLAPDKENIKILGFPCPNPEAFEGDELILPKSIFKYPIRKQDCLSVS